MSKIWESRIKLFYGATESDLDCKVGEVSEFSGIDWLEKARKAYGEGNKDHYSGGDDTVQGKVVSYDIVRGRYIATLPYGATLLTVHPYVDRKDEGEMIFIMQDGTLYSRSMHGAGEFCRIGTLVPQIWGNIRSLLRWGEVLTLVTDRRICWIVRDSATGCYTIRTDLPASPECEYIVEKVIAGSYITSEGEWARLDIRVPIRESYGLTLTEIKRWIENGESGRVPEEVRELVQEAVRERVGEYMEEMRFKGYLLSPVGVVASLSGHLPSGIKRVGEYDTPRIEIASVGFNEGVLTLGLRFSMVPYRIWCRYEVNGSEVGWRDHFPTLDIALSDEIRWWGGRLNISGPVSVINAAGERCRGFIVDSLSENEIVARIARCREFRISDKIPISVEEVGVRLISYNPAGDVYMPDYEENISPSATGGCVTDEGIVLFRDNYIMVRKKDSAVIYGCGKKIGDSRILSVVPTLESRSAGETGRMPLYVMTEEGIYLLKSDGKQGYGIGKMVSRDVAVCENCCVLTDSSAIFPTNRGLMAIGGSKTELLSECGGLDLSGISKLSYDYRSRCCIIRHDDGYTGILDLNDKRWTDDIASLDGYRDFIGVKGGLLTVDESNHLIEAILRREEVTVEDEGGDNIVAGDEGKGIGIKDESPIWMRTRPMRFGDNLHGCRILRIHFQESVASEWVLESSDDLSFWRREAQGSGDSTWRLRTPWGKYWRLTLVFSRPVDADRLRYLLINYA